MWKLYRGAYAEEPFVRLVAEKTGLHRYPDPKIVAGSNYADVGFEADPAGDRVVALCAIDNLTKGTAGAAVQCLNLAAGWDETTGLPIAGVAP